MIKDITNQIKKVIFFLETFDTCWKSKQMKEIFPPHSRDILEEIDNNVKSLSKYYEIIDSFARWKSIGVWNASDIITFLLTSRLHMSIADALSSNNQEVIKNGIEYILNFINYLLSTNIHPPKDNLDEFNFYDLSVAFSSTYKEAQKKIRGNLANYFAKEIWTNHKNYLNDLEKENNIKINSEKELKKLIRGNHKRGYLKYNTPPFLLKNVGLAKELFFYYKILSEDIGYLVPTLLYQRFFKGLFKSLIKKNYESILTAVPDFLIIRGGQVRGIELGRESRFFATGKGVLISKFSGVSGIATTQLNVEIGHPSVNQWKDFGLKCNRCYRCFRFCRAFIDGETGKGQSFYDVSSDNLMCESFCEKEKIENCRDSVVYANIMNFKTNRLNKKIVHKICLLNEELSEDLKPFPLFPKITGLKILKQGIR